MGADKIREAAALLGFDIHDIVTEQEVEAKYRQLAKKHHPDAGGDAETFNTLTAARSAMLGHVRRQSPQNALPDGRARCARCKGRGTVESRRAWRTMTVRCPECKGTGASG